MSILFEHYLSGWNLYEELMAPCAARHGLTYMELTVLMFLANNPRCSTAADVVKYRHLAKSHVSISVKGLEEKGLLRGRPTPEDHRRITLTLAPAADPVIREGRALQQRFRDLLFRGFSPEEERQLHRLLSRMDQNMKQARSGPAAEGV